MRKVYLSIIGLFLGFSTFAQFPQGFSYQAVIRNAEGKPIADKDVTIRIVLADNEAATNPLYTELHEKQTSPYGIVSLVVGAGTTTDNFSAVPWSGGTIWMKVEVDDGTGYQILGTTRLYSVPYALYTLNGVPGATGADGKDGLSIIWIGTYPSHPIPNSVNNAYYNSSDSTAYIWDGTTWGVLATHGLRGALGPNGKSAYEIWVENGHPGATVQDFIAALKGQTGETGVGIQSAILNTDSTLQLNFTNSTYYKTPIKIIGRRGATGPAGPQGPAGVGLNNRGAWSVDNTYMVGDYVFHESLLDNTKNSMWICQAAISPTTTKPKDDPTHWVEFEAPSGPQGPRGEVGSDGVGIASISLNADSTLTITLSDMSEYTTDKKIIGQKGEKGDKGETGSKGQDGVGIQNITLNPDSTLTFYYTNSNQYKTPIKIIGKRGATGPIGPQGPAGVGLTNKGLWSNTGTYLQGDYVFDESSSQVGVNSMWICQVSVGPSETHPKNDTGKWIEFQAPAGPQGEKGDPGQNGVGIASVTLNPDSTLTITMTDLSEFNTIKRIVGKNGKNGVGISSIALNQDSTLTIYYTNGTQFTTDRKIIGDKGEQGETGPAGPLVEGVAGQTLTHNGSGWVATNAITIDADTVGIGIKKPLSKLVVKGDPGADPDAPIFEVRNKEGQVVLGVYNEGVRVYVANPSGAQVKGTRAGFAVGGLTNQAKEEVEYFRITPDSARIYVNETSSGKGTRGGFAVGGLTNQAKEYTSRDLLYIAPEEARIYVKDTVPAEKGTRGGFAVGGLTNQAKGVTNNYLYIHRDSSRIYIDDTPGKGTRGGFAVGGLTNQAKGSDANFMNIETQSNVMASQPRILWYPLKNAFLVGQVKIDSPDSVGVNSLASGYETMAKGEYSQALGYQSKARGDYSIAIGKGALAYTTNTFAFGDGSKAFKSDAYAFGAGAIANGLGSFAFGSYGRDTATFLPTTDPTSADGDYSFAIGLGARATGVSSTALGISSYTSGGASTALGVGAKAVGLKSMALSAGQAIGKESFAVGLLSKAEGDYSIAIGRGSTKFGVLNHASGGYSIALGYSRVYGISSVGIGTTTINGKYAYGLGHSVTVDGDYAMGFGISINAKAYRSIVMGSNNVVSGNSTEWVATDPLFVIGNGTTTPANALTILKNGSMGIGTATPSTRLHFKGTTATDAEFYLQAGEWNTVGDYTQLTLGDGNHYIRGEYGNGLSFYTIDPNGFYFSGGESVSMRIGTTLNVSKLNVEKWQASVAMFNRRNSNGDIVIFYHGDAGLADPKVGSVSVSGSTVSYNTTSDRRVKENIVDTRFGLKNLNQLKVRDFTFKGSPTSLHTGFIAQELFEVYPEAVTLPEKTDGLWQVDYGKLTPLLVKSVQEQQLQIDSLANENAVLKEKLKEIDALKAELEAIKALLAK